MRQLISKMVQKFHSHEHSCTLKNISQNWRKEISLFWKVIRVHLKKHMHLLEEILIDYNIRIDWQWRYVSKCGGRNLANSTTTEKRTMTHSVSIRQFLLLTSTKTSYFRLFFCGSWYCYEFSRLPLCEVCYVCVNLLNAAKRSIFSCCSRAR